MNDLAEQALHGLDLARKQIVKHPLVSFAASGFVLSATIVVAGGRVGAGSATTPLNHWLGLLADNGPGDDARSGAVALVATAALLLLWVIAVVRLRQGACGERQVWTLAAFWAAPFVFGPPVLSSDVYTYIGQGLLQRAGADPYTVVPSHLGSAPIVSAMDPAWRGSASTTGPLGTFTEHLLVAIAGGNAFGALLMFRLLGVCCVVAIAALAATMAGSYRTPAIALTALNPALLLFAVSGFHFDAVVAALVLGSLVATAQRRYVIAVVLVCAAAAVRPTALPVVVVIVLAHCLGPRGRFSWRIAGRDVAIALVSLAAFTLIVRDGLGWRRNLSTVTLEHTPFAPASIVSTLVRPIVSAASVDDLAIGGRIAVVLAAIGLVLFLLVTVRRRPFNRTAGYVLLIVGACNPVLYPWSLIAGICCLAPGAAGPRRDWVVALSGVACVLAPIGLQARRAHELTLAALVIIAAALLVTLRARQQLHRQQLIVGAARSVHPPTGRW